MRSAPISLFLLLMTMKSVSQVQTPILNLKDSIIVSLVKKEPPVFPGIVLKSIMVIDARPETSSLGYTDISKLSAKRYVFRSSTKEEINNWFSNYLKAGLQNNNAATLLINIKKLRLSKNVLHKNIQEIQDTLSQKITEEGVVVKIEFFLKYDSAFIPLYRFDSTIFITGKLPKDASNFLTETLTLSASKFLSLGQDFKPANNKKIKLEDIIRSNEQGNDFAINNNTVLNKGIYRTFMEFKMNAPSITEFDVREGKAGTGMVYLYERGNPYPITNSWGYCNGNKIYINSGNSYSNLVKTGSSFYFLGIKKLTKDIKYNPELTNTGISLLEYAVLGYYDTDPIFKVKADKKLILRHYQVDMEMGEVY